MSEDTIYAPVRAPWTLSEMLAVDQWQEHYLLDTLVCPVCGAPLVRATNRYLRCFVEDHFRQFWYPGVILVTYRLREEGM